MTNDIIKRLEGSMKYDAINGSHEDRLILSLQIGDAIKELKRLAKRDSILSNLEAAGVDNWSGYEDAMSEVSDD